MTDFANAADARAIVVARNLTPELLAVAEAAEGHYHRPTVTQMFTGCAICEALLDLHAKMRETL